MARPAEQRAVVLAGGGLVGYAWEVGMLKGLQAAGVDLTTADLFVGTSAGALVTAQLRSGRTVDSLYSDVTGPAPSHNGPTPSAEDLQYVQDTNNLWQRPGVTMEVQQRIAIGQRALAAPHPLPEGAQESGVGLLADPHDWPDKPLMFAAVDTGDGTLRFFDRSTDAPFIAALAASRAIPGMMAPISIGGRRYMDGGVAGTNIQGALGYPIVIAVTPFVAASTDSELAVVRAHGGRATDLAADTVALQAMGWNAMDGARQKMSAQAGLDQVTRQESVIAQVRSLWSGK